ncbi:hypothetical protein ZWY2020_046963 [Hordeum vulgare]|nr:hypothetical protein ZWY2020_046963 [Hordeum vulgare]
MAESEKSGRSGTAYATSRSTAKDLSALASTLRSARAPAAVTGQRGEHGVGAAEQKGSMAGGVLASDGCGHGARGGGGHSSRVRWLVPRACVWKRRTIRGVWSRCDAGIR